MINTNNDFDLDHEYYIFIQQEPIPITELDKDVFFVMDEKNENKENEKEKNYEVEMIMCCYFEDDGKKWTLEIRGKPYLIKQVLQMSKKGVIKWNGFLESNKLDMVPTQQNVISSIMKEKDENNGKWEQYILRNFA